MGMDSSKGEGSWRRIVQANELGDDELNNFPPAGKLWPEIEFIKALQATFGKCYFVLHGSGAPTRNLMICVKSIRMKDGMGMET
jgi:hypothetical protein